MSNFLSSLAQVSDDKRKRNRPRTHATIIAAPDPAPDQSIVTPPDQKSEDLHKYRKYLRLLGLFDQDYYVAAYPDVPQAGIDPFEHFFLHGYLEGRQPNAIFDPAWYLSAYPEVKALNAQP